MDENEIRQLVEGVKRGDQASFEMLYMHSCRGVYFICVSFLGSEEDAKDVMQDVYATGYEKIYQLKDEGKFIPWINRIAVNKCKKILLKKAPLLMDMEDMGNELMEENENFLPEEYIMQKTKRKLVMDIMRNSLSDVQYETVILYYFNGLTIDEIADIMECLPGTVKNRLSVSRAKIRDGVLAYENRSGDKLYSVTGIPVLMSLLYEEANSMIIPDVLPGIIGTIASRFAAANMIAYEAATNGETIAEETIVGGVAKSTGGGIMKAGIHALKVKIAIGAAVAAVVGVGAFVLIKNNKSGGASDGGGIPDVVEQSSGTQIADMEEDTEKTDAGTAEQAAEFSGNWDEPEEYGYPPFWLKYANLGALEQKDLTNVMFYDKFTLGTNLKDILASYQYYEVYDAYGAPTIKTDSLDDLFSYSQEMVAPGYYCSIWAFEEKDNYEKNIDISVYNVTDKECTLGECIENNQFFYEGAEGYECLNIEYDETQLREQMPLVMDLLGKPTVVYARDNSTSYSDREGQEEDFDDTVYRGGGIISYTLFYDMGDYIVTISISEMVISSTYYTSTCGLYYLPKSYYEYVKEHGNLELHPGISDEYPVYEFE